MKRHSLVYGLLITIVVAYTGYLHYELSVLNRKFSYCINHFTTNIMKNPYNFLHKVIMKENLRKYTYVLNRHVSIAVSKNPYPNKVWFYWNDGVENAPEIVKICLKSIRKHIKNMEIIQLDSRNISNYIKLPKYIIDKYKAGIICEAHFSDIVRVNLLNEYGGLWMDSTVFLTGAIPDDMLQSEFFAPILCDINPKKSEKFVIKDLLLPGIFCNHFMFSAKPHNYVTECMVAFLNEYWKDRNWADYFFFYQFTAIALEEDNKFFDIFLNLIRKNYYTERPFLELDTNLNKKYSKQLWEQIRQFPIHKICGASIWRTRKIMPDTFAEKLMREELQ